MSNAILRIGMSARVLLQHFKRIRRGSVTYKLRWGTRSRVQNLRACAMASSGLPGASPDAGTISLPIGDIKACVG